LESVPGLHVRLKIRALTAVAVSLGPGAQEEGQRGVQVDPADLLDQHYQRPVQVQGEAGGGRVRPQEDLLQSGHYRLHPDLSQHPALQVSLFLQLVTGFP
jgi:hypothetical protein